MSAVRATPFLADAGATPVSRTQSAAPTDGSFAVQLLGVTADAAKTAAQKPGTVPGTARDSTASAPATAPDAASVDGAIVDAGPLDAAPAKLADLPAIGARGLGGKATDKSSADKSDESPAPDGSDTPGLLAMVALAVPLPMTSVAPAVPVAAGATDESAVDGVSVPVSLVTAAAAAAPAAGVAALPGQAPPSSATEAVAAPAVVAASTSAAAKPASTNVATVAAPSTSSATGPASTASATAPVDAPPLRARVRTSPPDAAASTASATGNASTAAATGLVVPVVPVQQGDAHPKDEQTNQPESLTVSATAASAPAAPVTPAVAAVAPTPVAQAAPTQAFTDQIARPILTLREAEAGTHVLTVRVAPDSLGPVTVRAHLGADGIRIELLAPTDQGRNALNAILPDLKRDLAQGGMNSTVNVSSQPDTNAQQNASGQFGARADAGAAGSGGQSARQDAWPSRTGSQPTHPQTPLRPATVGGTSLLDVYA